MALLDQVAKRGSGHTPSKDYPEYWNGGIKWISLADSSRLDKGLVTETDKEISTAGVKNSSAVVHPAGTVVLSRDAGVGKSGVLAQDMAVSQHFIAWDCTVSTELHNWYLYHWLQQQKQEFERVAVGSTIKTIGLPYFKKLKITLPPFTEQRRIAHILSTWDEAIAKAERLLESSLKRKRGLTRDLVLGQKRFQQFKAPWRQVSFRDVLKEVKRPVDWDDDQDYPLISVRRRSEGAFHRETLKGSEILTKKLNYAYEGEFLISKMQVVHGAMAVVPKVLDGMFISDSYLAFQSADEERFDINFIGWLSTTQRMYKAVRRCSYGVHIEKMTFDLDMFLNEKLHMPRDLVEQRLICTVLANAQSEVESAMNHLKYLRQEKTALMSQLLTGKRRVKLPAAKMEVQA